MRLSSLKYLVELHLIVFILGFTAVLGKMITVQAIQLVWFRMLIASLALLVVVKYRKENYHLPFMIILQVLLVGALVAIHWVLFFHAIKVSNVAVTLSCFASITLFTSFLEPFFYRRKILWLEVILGIGVLIGLYLIFQFETRYMLGIILATLAALTGSLFIVLNGHLTKTYPALTISWYELTGGFVVITIYVLFTFPADWNWPVPAIDWISLLVLGIVCTAYAFMKTIDLMKVFLPYQITLTYNLEPVYGIILSYFIFGDSEKMTWGFYLGASVILLSVFIYPIARRYLYPDIQKQRRS